jgi:hypothetical protein
MVLACQTPALGAASGRWLVARRNNLPEMMEFLSARGALERHQGKRLHAAGSSRAHISVRGIGLARRQPDCLVRAAACVV